MLTSGAPAPSAAAPLALAFASVSVAELPEALNSTVPSVAKLLRVVAITEWSATPSARAAPTEVLVPAASPCASVVTVDVSVALATTFPSTASVTPSPMEASVRKVVQEMATTGVTAVPPAAPPWAMVVTRRLLVASSVRSFAVTFAPSSMTARVLSSTTFTAIEAPMPVFAPVVASAAAPAAAELSMADVATNRRSVSGALTVFPLSTAAVVLTLTTPTDREPANPTFAAAPAPEVAFEAKTMVSGASAWTRTADPDNVALPSRALVVMEARFTAIATPTPDAVDSTGPPSASAEDFAFERA